MKQIKLYFGLLIIIMIIASCAANKKSVSKDPTLSNPDIAKLSALSKKSLNDASVKGCDCLKNYGSDLKSFLDEANPIIEKAKTAEDPSELFMSLMDSFGKLKSFTDCFSKIDPNLDEATKKALKDDMEKILGEGADKATENKKQLEIVSVYFEKNCPKEALLFKDFISFGEKMQQISNK